MPLHTTDLDPATARRALAQHAETCRLLGVDFVPVRQSVSTPTASSAQGKDAPTMPAPARAAPPAPAAGPLRPEQALALLDDLRQRHDAQCGHCVKVRDTYTQTVFGEGNPCAELMFVGEAPGADEDKAGRPFVGRSGQLLEKMIEALGLQRSDVYIANVLKARPPGNATPTPDEADLCGVWLRDQIAIIRPRVIVTLGKPAANFLLGNREAMGAMRGQWHEYTLVDPPVPVMPTFHPAYLLRAYTPENRKKVWADLQKAMERVKQG